MGNKRNHILFIVVCLCVAIVSGLSVYVLNGQIVEFNQINNEDIVSGNGIIIRLLIGISLLSLIAAVIVTIINIDNESPSKWIERRLPGIFLGVWGLGFVTYCIGTFGDHSVDDMSFWPFISVMPMAAIHATEMFLGMSDISAIYNPYHNSIGFMAMFDISHFLAVLVSLFFLFKHFKNYIKSKYDLFMERHSKTVYDDVYVFWNISDQAVSLARSINSQEGLPPYLIIFIKTPLEDGDESQPAGFDRLLNIVAMKQQELAELKTIKHCVVATTHHKLSTLNPHRDKKTGEIDILFNELNLTSVASILGRG